MSDAAARHSNRTPRRLPPRPSCGAARLCLARQRDELRLRSGLRLRPVGAAPFLFPPVRAEPYGTERTTGFFANLLPPDVVRRKLGPILHLSRHNVFGFLEALGADCAGAVSLRRPDEPALGDPEERLLELDEAEAAAILGQDPETKAFGAIRSIPLPVAEPDVLLEAVGDLVKTAASWRERLGGS